jgi:hypothetical protein
MFKSLNVLFANYLKNNNLRYADIIKKITRWEQYLKIIAPSVPAEQFSSFCIVSGFLEDKKEEINKKLSITLAQASVSQNAATMYNNTTSAPEEKSL